MKLRVDDIVLFNGYASQAMKVENEVLLVIRKENNIAAAKD